MTVTPDVAWKANKDLTDRLRDDEVLDALQRVGDKESENALARVNGFGPGEFRKSVQALRRRLPGVRNEESAFQS